jgi:hypothetical protein
MYVRVHVHVHVCTLRHTCTNVCTFLHTYMYSTYILIFILICSKISVSFRFAGFFDEISPKRNETWPWRNEIEKLYFGETIPTTLPLQYTTFSANSGEIFFIYVLRTERTDCMFYFFLHGVCVCMYELRAQLQEWKISMPGRGGFLTSPNFQPTVSSEVSQKNLRAVVGSQS